MTVLGDIERAFASFVFPNLLPLTILAVLAALGLAVLARKRGWDRIVRRHAGISAAIAVIFLAVAIPTGVYLASPLFTSTELVEAAPVAAGPVASEPVAGVTGAPTAPVVAALPTSTPAATAAPQPTRTPAASSTGPAGSVAPSVVPSVAPSVAPTPEPTAAPTPEPRSGEFVGADSFHTGSGTVFILEPAPGKYVLRFEGFKVRNGPDLYVYVSMDPDGYADGAVEVNQLRATSGSFNEPLPPGVDASRIRSVVIWCKTFSVQFAHAELPAS